VAIPRDVLEKLHFCRNLQKDENPKLCTKIGKSLGARLGLGLPIIIIIFIKKIIN
jgi:hypothetical protein